MSIDITPVPIDVVETIDRFISTEHADARKWVNRELLDDSGAYSLHQAAAQVYKRGYLDGAMAERARQNGERQRERFAAHANKEDTIA